MSKPTKYLSAQEKNDLLVLYSAAALIGDMAGANQLTAPKLFNLAKDMVAEYFSRMEPNALMEGEEKQ